jgi:hypothetical protein
LSLQPALKLKKGTLPFPSDASLIHANVQLNTIPPKQEEKLHENILRDTRRKQPELK